MRRYDTCTFYFTLQNRKQGNQRKECWTGVTMDKIVEIAIRLTRPKETHTLIVINNYKNKRCQERVVIVILTSEVKKTELL